MKSGPFRGVFAAAICLVLVLAACGGDKATPTQAPTRTVTPSASPTATSAAPQATPTSSLQATATSAPRATATPAPQATAAPSPAPTATTAPRAEPVGTLNIAVAELASERWIRRYVEGTADMVILMYADALIDADPQTRALKPLLATEWSVEVKPTEVVWTFKLRPNTPFNEGKGQMTAEDVKASWAGYLKPDAVASSAVLLRLLLNKEISNFEVVGPYEFRTHGAANSLDLATPNTVSTLQQPPVVEPKAYYESVGDAGFQKHPIGTGPYTFVSHVPNQRVTMEAVSNHWRKTSNVKTVTIHVVPEIATRFAMLRTGQIDFAPIEHRFKTEAQKYRELKIVPIKSQSNATISLGGMYSDLPDKYCSTCPWVGIGGNGLKVREALTLAIDVQAILDKVMFSEGERTSAPYLWAPGPYAVNDPNWKPAPYNPTRAKQLLAEAGYPNGFEITFAIFPTSINMPGSPDVGEAVAGFWENIGIKVKREPQEFSTQFRTKMVSRSTGGYAWLLGVVYQDEPLRNMRNQFVKASTLAYLHDPKIEEYLVKAAPETNEAKRFAYARELGSYMIEQRLGIPLFSINGLWVATTRMKSWDNIAAKPFLYRLETVVMER